MIIAGLFYNRKGGLRKFIPRAGYPVRMKLNTIALVLFLVGCILASGCTSPLSTQPVPTATPVVTTVAVTETPAPTALPTTRIVAHPSPTAELVTVTETTRIATDNPYLDNLNIRKRTFEYPIPNCVMQTAFPAIITDTYGIDQVEPKLASLSEDDYLHFLRNNTVGNAENTQPEDAHRVLRCSR